MSRPPRYLCIHGHFYQPPRENPWLERVEEQPSAAPFHDWNHRITAECYGPNAAARILDARDRIRKVHDNYELLSFNFGPTLLAWMEREAPDVYEDVRHADRVSQQRRGGHGNALAQVHSHVIMPLASRRDKVTQVRWGKDDFRHRFGREPQGMWLGEAAVDTETLEVLAEEGLRFTILAPHQAGAVRRLGGHSSWTEFTGDQVDPSRPYLCRLPSGRELTLFFYDGPISRSIAFEGALRSGEGLLRRLRDGFSDRRDWPQLLTVAVDGETFGHHSRFGEMALAWALDRLAQEGDVRVTNFAEYLSLHPPDWEVRIRENTSWSCAHGVERWRSDCGCTTGGLPGWNQAWRAPLRAALDWLKTELDEVFEGSDLFRDPWAARDAYHALLLDDTPAARRAFLEQHAPRAVGTTRRREEVRAWKALELARSAVLMFTSCAWFFDDVSRIEPVQVLSYAARALQLALEFDRSLEAPFLERLAEAKSNIPEQKHAAHVYEQRVKPLVVDLDRVVAHSAILNLATNHGLPRSVDTYDVAVESLSVDRSAGTALSVGRLTVSSRRTAESEDVFFCCVHFGGHDFHCAVRGLVNVANHEAVRERLLLHLRHQSVTQLIRTIDEHFGLRYYTLRDLFQEERKRVLYQVSDETLRRTEEMYRALYEENRQLMAFAQQIDVPVLASFRYATSFVLGVDVRRALAEPVDDEFFRRMERLAEDVRAWDAEIDRQHLAWRLRERAEDLVRELRGDPADTKRIAALERLLDVADAFKVSPDLWGVQNLYWKLSRDVARGDRPELAALLRAAPAARRGLEKLGARLHFHPELYVGAGLGKGGA